MEQLDLRRRMWLTRMSSSGSPRRIAGIAASVVAALVISTTASAQNGAELHLVDGQDSLAAVDANGFLLNPWWHTKSGTVPNIEAQCGFRIEVLHLERRRLMTTRDGCLSEYERRVVTADEVNQPLLWGSVCTTGSKTGDVRGHINWFPVTATGTLYWNSFSSGWGDLDVNFDLVPVEPSAVTTGNSRPKTPTAPDRAAYHIEMYSQETLARLPDPASGFWKELEVSIQNDSAPRRLIDGHFAIVTGLFGVDAVHDFGAELHPIYAMAILAARFDSGEVTREKWHVMVRNSGSEGDCAAGTIPLRTNRGTMAREFFDIDLGKWNSARVRSVQLVDGPFVSDTSIRISAIYARLGDDSVPHLLLRFDLARPTPGASDQIVLGSVTVEWIHPPSESWRFDTRFGDWVPQDVQPVVDRLITGPLHLTQLLTSPPRSRTFTAVPPFQAPRSRSPKPDILLQLPSTHIAIRAADTTVRARPVTPKSAAWAEEETVGRYCTHDQDADQEIGLLCSGHFALLAAAQYAKPDHASIAPAGGVYVFPHSWASDADGARGIISNAFASFGYRFEVRSGNFRKITHKDDNLQSFGAVYHETSLQVVPFLAPNTYRLTPLTGFTPYTLAHLGVSYLDRRDLGKIWGWGIGVQVDRPRNHFFLELETNARNHTYENQWIVEAGAIVTSH